MRVLCELGASLTARTHGDVASSSASIVCPATGAEVSCAVGSNPLHIAAMMGHNAAVRTMLMAYVSGEGGGGGSGGRVGRGSEAVPVVWVVGRGMGWVGHSLAPSLPRAIGETER